MDKTLAGIIADAPELRVETERYGPFTFRIGVDWAALEILILRVEDARQRFYNAPLAEVAEMLEKEILVNGIFGTNSIEGGTLSEQETQETLATETARDTEQQRVLNLKDAYALSREAAARPDWRWQVEFIQQLHAAITTKLPHRYDQPGVLRDNPKGILTHVGDAAHPFDRLRASGGRYKPPQSGRDIRLLLESLVKWHERLQAHGIPVLLRAPLAHYYYELIHPFWDGNGRVGRVLEATLLQADGFRYTPFAQARYYFEHLDEYFSLFNTCRKQSDNTPFVHFFLEGLLAGIHTLHDRANRLIAALLYENRLARFNPRQRAIAGHLLRNGPQTLAQLRQEPWYQAMYAQHSDKTKQRDLRGLRESGMLRIDGQNRIQAGIAGG